MLFYDFSWRHMNQYLVISDRGLITVYVKKLYYSTLVCRFSELIGVSYRNMGDSETATSPKNPPQAG